MPSDRQKLKILKRAGFGNTGECKSCGGRANCCYRYCTRCCREGCDEF